MTFQTTGLGFLEGIGGMEMGMILFVVLLLFGADRLPELARVMGRAMREFKKAASGVEEEIKAALQEQPKPPPVPPATVGASPLPPSEPPTPPQPTPPPESS